MQQVIPAIALEISVLLLGVLMLLAEAFSRRADRSHMARYAIAILAAIVGFSFFTKAAPEHIEAGSYWAVYSVDATALFFKRIALCTTIAFLVMALEYRHILAKYIPGAEEGRGTGEFYCLPVFICAGLMFMASAVDFILIFVSLELVTIGFYALVAYMRRHTQSLEAGVKYLILGALSTGFLIYGITWIFGLTGETNLKMIGERLKERYAVHQVADAGPATIEFEGFINYGTSEAAKIGDGPHTGNVLLPSVTNQPIFSTKQKAVVQSDAAAKVDDAIAPSAIAQPILETKQPEPSPVPLLFGIVLILVALGFKVAAAPFQLWVPDVYQGAPTPVTAFLSVGSKAAGFVVLVRVLDVFLAVPAVQEKVTAVLVLLAAATLIYGNITALPQENLKRLFAYSSIAHAGYLLIACASLAGDPASAKQAISFYLAGYLLMTLLSFIILIVVARHSRGDDIRHFNGLGKRSPFLAGAMTLAIASLAGIPLTAGFLGKFLIFKTAVATGHWVLVGIGIVAVAAGFYYYLKVIAAMYWHEPTDATPIEIVPLTRLAITALGVLIIVFGIFPAPILTQLQERHPASAVYHAQH